MKNKKIWFLIIFCCVFICSSKVEAAKMHVFDCEFEVNFIRASEGGKAVPASKGDVIPLKIEFYKDGDNESIKAINHGKELELSSKHGNNNVNVKDLDDNSIYSIGQTSIIVDLKPSDFKSNGKNMCPGLVLQESSTNVYKIYKGEGDNEILLYTPSVTPKFTKEYEDSLNEKDEEPPVKSVVKTCNPLNYLSTDGKEDVNIDYSFKMILNSYNDGTREICINGKGKNICSSVDNQNQWSLQSGVVESTVYYFRMLDGMINNFFVNYNKSNYQFSCPETVYVYEENHVLGATEHYYYVFTTDLQEAEDNSDKITELEPKPEESTSTPVEVCKVLPDAIKKYLMDALKLIRWGSLVVMIILGTLDFVKATASNDQEAMKKASSNFIKRLIAVIILFMLPLLVELILYLAGLAGFGTCYPPTDF